MSARNGFLSHPVLHVVIMLALLVGSVYLTEELREKEQEKAPAVGAIADLSELNQPVSGELRWERLKKPDRTVLRGTSGEVMAVFTDGARTATLIGPSRTFTEPARTKTRIVTENWVRLMPEHWSRGAEKEQWFKQWFKEYFGSEEADLFAFAFQYMDKAPVKKDGQGIPYAGDAGFGPVDPDGEGGYDLRLEQSDFYDYLGIPYTFRDGTTMRPEKRRYRTLDSSGFIRAVMGYRGRYPLRPADNKGDGLPRTANGMARSGLGVDVIPLSGDAPKYRRPASADVLQPGDLVFFWLDARTNRRLDHVGMYLGPDTEGRKIFISSSERANGPTIGDKDGSSRLDGDGRYASALRSAKRL
jgi:NlpC/P60 family